MKALNLVLVSFLSILVAASPLRAGVRSPLTTRGSYAEGQVSFDQYSLSINGERVFLQSGEFHPWRNPVPALWREVLQKMVSAGFNAVSTYTHWGLINPSPGVLDFTGFNDLALFLTIAKEVGIYVNVRPGPYINAETAGGGIPGWVTTIKGPLRSSSNDYTAAWKPYIQAVSEIVVPFQINNGGTVILMQIENEFADSSTNGESTYFQNIKTTMQNSGIVVPLMFNDVNMANQYATGSISADLYGFDQYPQGFDCKSPLTWKPVVNTYASYHAKTNPAQPLYIPEFQGGSFDPWGGPGYDACRVLTGSDFESVFYKGLLAQNLKMVSYYMAYGGTSWGFLPEPTVYTSYDYGAMISEARQLSVKFGEFVRQSFFLRSMPAFCETNLTSTSTSIPGTHVSTLTNSNTGSRFAVVRQANSGSFLNITFDLPILTQSGTFSSPVVIHGRQSKIITSDIQYGASSSYHYSTAEILFAGTIGSKEVLYLFGDPGDTFVLSLFTTISTTLLSTGPATFTSNGTTISFSTTSEGISLLELSPTSILIFSDTNTAGNIYNPIYTATDSLASIPLLGSILPSSPATKSSILIGGAYLIRNATVSGVTLSLNGDLDALMTTSLTILAPATVLVVKLNGNILIPSPSPLNLFGLLTFSIAPTRSPSDLNMFPTLTNWQHADSLPEISPSFNDSTWTIITSTGALNNPTKLLSGALRLYACEYGFCEGEVLYRGYFVENGQTGLKIATSGGTAAAGSVWLNGYFLGSTFDATAHTFTFPTGSLVVKSTNVVTVLTDNMGQEEGYQTPKNPRGIIGYALVGSNNISDFTIWKIQGKEGGNVNFPDKTRKIFNAGGLYSDRSNWHLPLFNTSNSSLFSPLSPLDGIDKAGVGFFRTDFNLNLLKGFDYPVGILIDGLNKSINLASTTRDGGFRSELWINGWKYGRFISYLGPQTLYPVPQGILDFNGHNSIAISIWAVGSSGASIRNITFSLKEIFSWDTEEIVFDNPSPGLE